MANLDEGKRMMAILGISMPKIESMEDSNLVHALAAYASFEGDAQVSTAKNFWFFLQTAAMEELKKRLHRAGK